VVSGDVLGGIPTTPPKRREASDLGAEFFFARHAEDLRCAREGGAASRSRDGDGGQQQRGDAVRAWPQR
jgi:hypothetical protein